MFEQFAQTYSGQNLPFKDLLTLNTKTLQKLGEQQSRLLASVMDEGFSFAKNLPEHKEIGSLWAAQKQFAERVQQHAISSFKASYTLLNAAREEGSSLLSKGPNKPLTGLEKVAGTGAFATPAPSPTTSTATVPVPKKPAPKRATKPAATAKTGSAKAPPKPAAKKTAPKPAAKPAITSKPKVAGKPTPQKAAKAAPKPASGSKATVTKAEAKPTE